jgi:hypothetical protein
MLNYLSFKTVNLIGGAVFVCGMVLAVMGAMYLPALLFVSEVFISVSGALLYVMQFLLYGTFKYHSVIMSIAYAISTLLF